MRSRVRVLGVEVDPLRAGELEAEISRFVREGRRATVLNVNAHCLNLAWRDSRLRAALRAADLVFCDGDGVRLAARLCGGYIPERITYADWIWSLAGLAAGRGFSVYLLGARPGVAEEAARRLSARHPALRMAGTHHGYFNHRPGSPGNEEVIRRINAADPDILLVCFGMPEQELWLFENRERLSARVALTGGAALDYASGRLRRGPRLLTENGMEWLARLAIEPHRLWRRYLIGNPLFLLRVLGWRLLGRRQCRRGILSCRR
ncbi:WecB/TagA/CpsF family glycosyltransferase [Rubrobacter xylanophilus]|uniref:WecB/TagA/CpsF family glycosyltransferase n=1 Tax=Rubrobacter xylanophilus TaxID=49319 RepID=UPI001C644534|nr:WecB/TagA/CpsF family glycosyltransferase [Rubrobacter xylanophilus]